MPAQGYIDINNDRIYYQFENFEAYSKDKPFVIFLHEGLGSVAQWREFPKALCQALDVTGLSYDRVGHGKSSAFSEPRNIDYLIGEAQIYLSTLLQKLKIHNPLILFGHSDGATLALLTASFLKERVIAVISECHHVVYEEKAKTGLLEIVKNFEKSDIKTKLAKYHGAKTEKLFNTWSQTWLSDKYGEWNLESNLKEIECPVFAIQGKDDEYATYLQLEKIIENCKNDSEIWFIPNCGHAPHKQFKKEIIERTKQFLLKLNNHNN